MINFRLAHVEAMKLAIKLHSELHSDLENQVDVYSAIEHLGVSVAFLPLTNMSGGYLPASPETGNQAGIVINSKHPRSRQRYSAAHELGHHMRDASSTQLIVDRDTDFLARAGTVKDQREVTAEAFAAWFLMPRQLIMHLLGDLNITGEPSAEQAYRLSLALGTSYLATVSHLRTLRLINQTNHDRLAKVPPKWIKAQIAAHGPGDSWGDVWLVKEEESERAALTPRPGDEIVVELREIPTSGYVWRLRGHPEHVHVLDSVFEEPDADSAAEERYGATGSRRIVLRADHPGHETLRIEMTRPWEKDGLPQRVFTLDLSIERKQETQLAGVS